MSELELAIRDGRTAFEPGETIEVLAAWRLDEAPAQAEVRLVWYTRGKGGQDWSLVQRVAFENPGPVESRSCTLQLPPSPYSFSGRLVSLIWAVELVLPPSRDSKRLDITIAPHRQEVVLHRDARP